MNDIERALGSAVKTFMGNVSRRDELKDVPNNGVIFTNKARVTTNDNDIIIAVTMIDLKKTDIDPFGIDVRWVNTLDYPEES